MEEVKRPPGRLKIAMMRKDHVGAALHPECLAAVEKAGKLCESLGHVVEEAYPDLDFDELRPSIRLIISTNTARDLSKRWQNLGRARMSRTSRPLPGWYLTAASRLRVLLTWRRSPRSTRPAASSRHF